MQSLSKKIAAQLAVLENLAKWKQWKTCNLHLMKINKLTRNWNYGQKLLSKRWKASLPGFVRQVKYDPDQYKFVCLCAQRKEDSTGKEIISTEEVLCNYDYIDWMYGESFAKYVKEMGTITTGKEKHFVKIPSGYDQKTINFQKVICRVRWVSKQTWEAPKRSDRKKGKWKHIVIEHFVGYTNDGKQLTLTEKEVEDMFGKSFVDHLKCMHASGGFIDVPVGKVRKFTLMTHKNLNVAGALNIQYPQGDVDLCIINSLTSVLHQIWFESEAKAIYNEYLEDAEGRQIEIAPVHSMKLTRKYLPKAFQYIRSKKQISFEQVNCILKDGEILLGVLSTGDFHQNHTISIYNGFIYDANKQKAIPFCKEGLDYYCGDSDGKKGLFVSFHKSYTLRLQGKKNQEKRNWDNVKQNDGKKWVDKYTYTCFVQNIQ